MTSFLGEYEVAIDAKGRFLLPSGFRKQLAEGMGEKFVINRGFENCVTIYTMEVWNAISEKINRLNDFNPKGKGVQKIISEWRYDSGNRQRRPYVAAKTIAGICRYQKRCCVERAGQ